MEPGAETDPRSNRVWVRQPYDPELPMLSGRWYAVDVGEQDPAEAAAEVAALPWVECCLTEADYQDRVRYLELSRLEELRHMTGDELLAETEYRERSIAEITYLKGTRHLFYAALEASCELDRIWLDALQKEVERRRQIGTVLRTGHWTADADFIAKVKDRIPLHEFIVHEMPMVKLKRAGHVYQARCPFHEDTKTPSFTVYESHFICFGCGAHGDVFDLAVQILGEPHFRAAVERACRYAGVALPQAPPAHDPMTGRMANGQFLPIWERYRTSSDGAG
jgi:CHC2 zinc finger